MTELEAKMLVARLLAAFPFPQVPVTTAKLYVEQFAQLGDVAAAQAVVEGAIRNLDRLPAFAVLLRDYQTQARRNAAEWAKGRELEQPPDPENAKRARELFEHLRRSMKDVA